MSIQSEILLIKMQSKLSGIKFNWEFKLSKMKNSHLKHHFVVPILFNCAEYQQRELELIKIIQAKDKELDDYKSQGIELTRKYLETEPFETSKFDNDLRSKSEIADLIEDPVQCLSTSLHQKVYQSCVEKYLALNFNSQSTESSNDLESSDIKNMPLKTAQRPSESETLSREKKRDEIEKVLDDENKSGPKMNKKKKLFK
ncbi:non-homologous end-joining factor 1-like isoform X2 [Brachionus plicatilis]|uniref:Non-homologous end-joining factor 1-like isoform X2 n=1 Tax=Brachionus plicatilis TaxID=10195 RepID=A0A3M7S0M1_BRAPC|nr:non-homologous end-joining factor 1-like isoform X2 [Brachionus plicatilis]